MTSLTTKLITVSLFSLVAARGDWKEALNLANRFRDSGSPGADAEYAKAEELVNTGQQQALERIWNDWSTFRIKLGQYERAEPLLRKSLAAYAAAGTANSMAAGVVMYNLALVERAMGHAANAESLYKKSLAIFETKAGAASKALPLGMSELAMLYLETGRLEDARRCMKRALNTGQKILGSQDAAMAGWLVEMSEVDRQARDYDSARADINQAQRTLERSPTQNPLQMARVVNQLARIEYETGHYSKASDYWRQTLTLMSNGRSDSQEEMLAVKASLGRVMAATGKFDESEEMLMSIVHSAEGAGFTTPLVTALRYLGILYMETKRYDLAHTLLLRSYTLTERKIGPEAVSTAICLNDLVAALLALGRPGEAETFSRRAVTVISQTRSPAPAWVDLLETHSRVLAKLKHRREAAQFARQVRELRGTNPVIHRQTIDVSDFAAQGKHS
jgi:tetratricopeptide (TPR) repeat protein